MQKLSYNDISKVKEYVKKFFQYIFGKGLTDEQIEAQILKNMENLDLSDTKEVYEVGEEGLSANQEQIENIRKEKDKDIAIKNYIITQMCEYIGVIKAIKTNPFYLYKTFVFKLNLTDEECGDIWRKEWVPFDLHHNIGNDETYFTKNIYPKMKKIIDMLINNPSKDNFEFIESIQLDKSVTDNYNQRFKNNILKISGYKDNNEDINRAINNIIRLSFTETNDLIGINYKDIIYWAYDMLSDKYSEAVTDAYNYLIKPNNLKQIILYFYISKTQESLKQYATNIIENYANQSVGYDIDNIPIVEKLINYYDKFKDLTKQKEDALTISVNTKINNLIQALNKYESDNRTVIDKEVDISQNDNDKKKLLENNNNELLQKFKKIEFDKSEEQEKLKPEPSNKGLVSDMVKRWSATIGERKFSKRKSRRRHSKRKSKRKSRRHSKRKSKRKYKFSLSRKIKNKRKSKKRYKYRSVCTKRKYRYSKKK